MTRGCPNGREVRRVLNADEGLNEDASKMNGIDGMINDENGGGQA